MKNKGSLFLAVFSLSLALFIHCHPLAAQSKGKKINYRAEWSYHDEDLLPGITKLVGNVVFSQDNIIGYCDSAYLHEKNNNLEAFGRVVRIHINDSVTLFGKYVFYNGNARMASISKDVRLEDKSSTLFTDSLIYDLNHDVGYYITGGKTVSKDNILTSKIGFYHTKINEIRLNEEVELVNDSYHMDCDSLAFNTQTETVYFISRTRLVSEENIIYTSSGWYDTKADLALLVENVEILNESQKVFGDSIFYDKNQHFGTGWNNVTIVDSVKNYILKGNYAEYYENGGISYVTDSAMLIIIDSGDSLYAHSDRFEIHIDSLKEPQLLLGYRHVKFFRKDMQGACDSMAYIMPDSTLTMYYNPVLWSNGYQLTGDTIVFRILDSVNTRVQLIKSGFIIASLFGDTEFNQIKGIHITGYIYDRQLTKVDVIGNAECLYFLLEEDSSIIGVNSSVTSEMRITFEDNEIAYITLFNSPDGKIYPDHMLESTDRIFKDFRWLNKYRPYHLKDIFHTPIPRVKGEEPDAVPVLNKDP